MTDEERVAPFSHPSAQSTLPPDRVLSLSDVPDAGSAAKGWVSLGGAVSTTAVGGKPKAAEGGLSLDAMLEEELMVTAERLGASEAMKTALTTGEVEALDNFFLAFNKAVMDKLALERERAELEEEHKSLKDILAQYLQGLSVTGDAVDTPNPLVVVNGRTGAATTVRAPPCSLVVVEAAHRK